MNIVVIGGTGLMGPSLVKELISGGHQVTCLNRRGISEFTPEVGCDRGDESALRSALEGLEFDVVIDMIPYSRKDAEMLSEVLAARSKVQLIAVSSVDVYLAYGRLHGTEPGPIQACPIRESDALRTHLGQDGESYDKIAVEQVYLKNFADVSILRMPAIYGWPDERRIKEFVELAEADSPMYRVPSQVASWKYSRASNIDCAHAGGRSSRSKHLQRR